MLPLCSSENQLLFHFSATHPRHYAENGLRLLEEGDRVEGSSGFPGSVCLHPFHGPPPLCTASSLVLPSSPRLAQRHRVCGAPGNRHGKSLNLLLLLQAAPPLLLLQGWMLVSPRLRGAQPPVFSVVVVFNLTSKFDIRAEL